MLKTKLAGIKIPSYKNTKNCKPINITPVKYVYLPTKQHIGKPAIPTVKIGEHVLKGQLIAESDGVFSSPVYSSVSGTVLKIEKSILSDGKMCDVLVIESDGKDRIVDDITPPRINSYEDFIDAVHKSGTVGLGGSGFPTAIKLDVKNKEKIDTVIINGAECEPYITSDTMTLVYDFDAIFEGIELIKKFLQVENIFFGIEKHNKAAIKQIKIKSNGYPYVSVKELTPLYPQGGEKIITYNLTGRIVPEGKYPKDVGVVVINCTTVATIAKFIKTGIPLIDKCITVDGSAISKPCNLYVPLGTPVKDILDFCGVKSNPKKIILGGVMMGVTAPDLSMPITKSCNALIVQNEHDAKPMITTSCIRCGKCIYSCPVRLNPVAISKAYKMRDLSAIKATHVNICMECGCCSYVCPTRQPLVEHNKLAKVFLYEGENK